MGLERNNREYLQVLSSLNSMQNSFVFHCSIQKHKE